MVEPQVLVFAPTDTLSASPGSVTSRETRSTRTNRLESQFMGSRGKWTRGSAKSRLGISAWLEENPPRLPDSNFALWGVCCCETATRHKPQTPADPC